MADVVPLLVSWPEQYSTPEDYDTKIRSWLKKLSNTPQHALLKDSQGDIFDLLDPAVNSVSYLYVLLAHIQHHGEKPKNPKQISDTLRPDGSLWLRIEAFLVSFDPVQIRYVGKEWRRLLEFIGHVSRTMGKPQQGLELMCAATLRLDQNASTFTSTHLLIVRLAVEYRAYRHVLGLLQNYVDGFPTKMATTDTAVPAVAHTSSSSYITASSGFSETINATDVQEYFYLGAMCFIGLRMYEDALLYLESVLVVPSHNTAHIFMVEAYSKFVLVGCLLEGRLLSPPRTTNNQALKSIKAMAKPYETLAETYYQRNISKLRAEVDVGAQKWTEDGNTGLVQELVKQFDRKAVARLGQIYAAVPLTKVAEQRQQPLQETQAYLTSLIADGHLNATIESPSDASNSAILRFYSELESGPLAKSEEQQFGALMAQTSRTNDLAEKVKAADTKLRLTKEYIDFLRRKKAKEASTGHGEEQMDVTWNGMDGDEDIMAG